MFLYLTLLTLVCVPVEGYFKGGIQSFLIRGSDGKSYPLSRYPMRFIGKRVEVNDDIDIADNNESSIENKRDSPESAETKLKILEKVLFNLRTLEAEQDNDFRTLLEKHKSQLKQLFEALPPYVDRRLFHSFLSSLIKRRFNAWGGKRDDSKRPSFNAWGGRKKRSNVAEDDVVNGIYSSSDIERDEFIKRKLESDKSDEIPLMKRPSFNAWGGKRNYDKASLNPNAIFNLLVHSPKSQQIEAKIARAFKLADSYGRNPSAIANVVDQFDEEGKRGFNAWGGKRGESMEDTNIGEKRANFNPWGGKRIDPTSEKRGRSGFNAWGGKRAGPNEFGEESGVRWPPSFVNIEFEN